MIGELQNQPERNGQPEQVLREPTLIMDQAIRPAEAVVPPPNSQPGNGSKPSASTTSSSATSHLELPRNLDRAANHAGAEFGLHRSSVLPPLLTTSGAALGQGGILETPLFPAPVNASLICLFGGEGIARVEQLAHAAAQVLKEAQEDRLGKLQKIGRKSLRSQRQEIEARRKEFFISDAVQNPDAQSVFASKLSRLSALERPLLFAEDCAPGTLGKAAEANGGAGLLAIYNRTATADLLNHPRKVAPDLDLLACAFAGQSPQASFAQNSKFTLVRPAASCLLFCTAPVLGEWLTSSEPMVRRLMDRALVFGALVQEQPTAPATGVHFSRLPEWVQSMARLLSYREASSPMRFALSRQANATLREYAQQLAESESEHGRLAHLAPVLVAKLALLLHLWSSDKSAEIPVTTVRTGIQLAKEFLHQTSQSARALTSKQEAEILDHDAAVMLEKIRQKQPIGERNLFRTYDDCAKRLHEPVLLYLMRNARVRKRPDGLLEALPRQER